MPKLSRNEQLKLSANYFNGLAIAVLGIGVFAPTVSLVAGNPGFGTLQLAGLVSGCMMVSASLHYIARLVLEGIEE